VDVLGSGQLKRGKSSALLFWRCMVTLAISLGLPLVLWELWRDRRWRALRHALLAPFRSWTGLDEPRKPELQPQVLAASLAAEMSLVRATAFC